VTNDTATEEVVYLTYPQAVAEHIELMRYYDEIRYGVFDRTLIESALARPQQAAVYEAADLPAQVRWFNYSGHDPLARIAR
jgi:hypothetical protein